MVDYNTFHVGDSGILFKFRAIKAEDLQPMDISTATEMYMLFKKPDGTSFYTEAQFSTDGSDGYIQYTSIAGDLDTVGTWQVQGFITLPSFSGRLEKKKFKVESSLYTGEFEETP